MSTDNRYFFKHYSAYDNLKKYLWKMQKNNHCKSFVLSYSVSLDFVARPLSSRNWASNQNDHQRYFFLSNWIFEHFGEDAHGRDEYSYASTSKEHCKETKNSNISRVDYSWIVEYRKCLLKRQLYDVHLH